MKIRPTELLFSQTSIASSFTNGINIHAMIDEIKRNRSYDNGLLPLEVARDRYDGRLYCQNNRRLYMFRVLELDGYISTIDVVEVRSMRPKPPQAGPEIYFRDRTSTRRYR